MNKEKKKWYQSKTGIVAIILLLPFFVAVGFLYLLIKVSGSIWQKDWSLPKRAGVIAGMWGIILVAFASGNSHPATLSATTQITPTEEIQHTFIQPSIVTSTPFVTETPTPTIFPTIMPSVRIEPTKSFTSPTIEPTSASSSTGLSNNDYYTNTQGNEVHSPAYTTDGSIPQGATAKCVDGTYSFSQSHRGTCSHHGGVASWL